MCVRLSRDSMRFAVSCSCGCGFVVSTVVAKCTLPPEQARDVFRDLDEGSGLSVVVCHFVTDTVEVHMVKNRNTSSVASEYGVGSRVE